MQTESDSLGMKYLPVGSGHTDPIMHANVFQSKNDMIPEFVINAARKIYTSVI